MEKKNKLRAGRICVGATINSLAATSAFVVIALMLYELTGKLNVPYSTLSVAYTFAYAGMMLASFFGGKIITRNGRLGPVISTSAALFGLLSLTYTNSVWLVYVAALVYGFGQVLTFFYMNIAIISWYGVGQSTVLGVAQAATTVGAAVVTPVVASLLESSGYTKAGIVLTAIIVVTMCVSTHCSSAAICLPNTACLRLTWRAKRIKKQLLPNMRFIRRPCRPGEPCGLRCFSAWHCWAFVSR